MNTPLALRLLFTLPGANALLAAGPGDALLEGKPLNSFSVAPEFALVMPGPRDSATAMSGPPIFRSVDDQPRAVTRHVSKYRSVTLQPGDEIVSVNGRPVTGLSREDFLRTFTALPGTGKINLEVRQPQSKEIRPATAVRASHPEEKFSDDATLKQFAEFARPACIFNERGKVLFDTGAGRVIASIAVDDRSPDGDGDLAQLPRQIVVRFKQPPAKTPLLMLADSYQARITTEQKSDREWSYTLDFGGDTGVGPLKICRFRISI